MKAFRMWEGDKGAKWEIHANPKNGPLVAWYSPWPDAELQTIRDFATALLAACDHVDAPEPPIVLTVELSEEDVQELAAYTRAFTDLTASGRACLGIAAAARAAVAKLDGEAKP
jgi:hypothetical protein